MRDLDLSSDYIILCTNVSIAACMYPEPMGEILSSSLRAALLTIAYLDDAASEIEST